MSEFSNVKVRIIAHGNGEYSVEVLKPYKRFDGVQIGFITSSLYLHNAFDGLLHAGKGELTVLCDMEIDSVDGVRYAFIYAWSLLKKSYGS